MRVPKLVRMRRHNIAVLTVSFGRVGHTRDHGDLICGYNAVGRLSRVVFLDPRRELADDSREDDAIRAAIDRLRCDPDARPDDVDVLQSALRRAAPPAFRPSSQPVN